MKRAGEPLSPLGYLPIHRSEHVIPGLQNPSLSCKRRDREPMKIPESLPWQNSEWTQKWPNQICPWTNHNLPRSGMFSQAGLLTYIKQLDIYSICYIIRMTGRTQRTDSSVAAEERCHEPQLMPVAKSTRRRGMNGQPKRGVDNVIIYIIIYLLPIEKIYN